MPPNPSSDRIPTTAFAVLGLLTFQEMSGYDLKRFADQSLRYFFWSPARSQIYAELRRLTALGFATEREVAQDRRPDKRLYRITPEGEAALRDWLESPEIEPDVHKSPFLLRLFFGYLTDPEVLIQQFEDRRTEAIETLEQYQAIQERIGANESFLFPYLTLKSGMAAATAQLAWTEDVLATLRQRRDAPPGATPPAHE